MCLPLQSKNWERQSWAISGAAWKAPTTDLSWIPALLWVLGLKGPEGPSRHHASATQDCPVTAWPFPVPGTFLPGSLGEDCEALDVHSPFC